MYSIELGHDPMVHILEEPFNITYTPRLRKLDRVDF